MLKLSKNGKELFFIAPGSLLLYLILKNKAEMKKAPAIDLAIFAAIFLFIALFVVSIFTGSEELCLIAVFGSFAALFTFTVLERIKERKERNKQTKVAKFTYWDNTEITIF